MIARHWSIAGILQLAVSSWAAAQVPAPKIFAPGTISGGANDGAPTFTVDGRTLFFTRSGNTWPVILESHFMKGHWTVPSVAQFSGTWADLQPVLARDGSYLIFVSARPIPGDSAKSGDSGSALVAHFWRTNRTKAGWSDPVVLPTTIHIAPQMFRPSIAADGTLYFMAMVPGKRFRLFQARFRSGAFETPEPLPFSDGTTSDVDPEITPDGSVLFFSSTGRTSSDSSHEHLFFVQRAGGGWGPVQAVHYAGESASNDNEPRISADLQILFFSSDRTLPVTFPRTRRQAVADAQRMSTWDDGYTNVWTLPLTAVLAERGDQRAP